jgi:hypothetical protein
MPVKLPTLKKPRVKKINIRTATEKQMREADAPWPDTLEELTAYIKVLANRKHDYGTCVYAMSMASLATFRYISGRLGVTGFQASCADLDFLGRSRGMKQGFRILNYEHLLYPQYLNAESFPSLEHLLVVERARLGAAAKKLLESHKAKDSVCPDVRRHWESLVKAAQDAEKAAEKKKRKAYPGS